MTRVHTDTGNHSTGGKVVAMNRNQDKDARPFFPAPVGHEKILAACKKQRLEMGFEYLDGTKVTGEITQFDRWTITIIQTNGQRRTIYKHALKHFEAVQLSN